MKESWKYIIGVGGYYQVSNFGRVRRVDSQKILVPSKVKDYLQVSLYVNGKSIHRYVHCLVADAFIGPCPFGMEVNHKDLNKENNSVDNLEYLTHSDNVLHAYGSGKVFGWKCVTNRVSSPGEKNGSAKITWEQARKIIKLYLTGNYSYRSLGKSFGLGFCTIGEIVRNRAWKE